ncbi:MULTISPECIES: hypothetical protein [Halorussus]|uniref:hypothetical protein n=1 Tax=Halorussus TaxID=1070314 RepID=UPI0020A00341|nr:hypothetical protein [Halorussus vallis]USZ74206.1 hypothetical protein NGM07_12200 [Halorussus vallis]
MSPGFKSAGTWPATLGGVVGLLAAAAGIAGAVGLLWTSVLPYVVFDGVPHLSGSLEAANAPVILFWALVLLAAALAGGYWVRTRKLGSVWAVAIAGTLFAGISLFSVGLYVLPFGLLMLVAAVLLTVGRPRGSAATEAAS